MPAYPYVPFTYVGTANEVTTTRLNTSELGIRDMSQAPTVRVTHTADQTITASTWSPVAFNTDDWDQAAGAAAAQHDTVTNNQRLTALFAGIYLVTAFVQWASSATGDRYVAIVKNGGATPTPAQGDCIQHSPPVAAAPSIRQCVTGLYSLAINDWVVCAVWQNTAGGLAVLGTTAATRPEFGMVRVG